MIFNQNTIPPITEATTYAIFVSLIRLKKTAKLTPLNEKEIKQMQPAPEKYKYEYNGKEFR